MLGLRDKLSEKYLQNGRIIPPAPDKSVIGMTKIKMSKEEDNSDQSGTSTSCFQRRETRMIFKFRVGELFMGL